MLLVCVEFAITNATAETAVPAAIMAASLGNLSEVSTRETKANTKRLPHRNRRINSNANKLMLLFFLATVIQQLGGAMEIDFRFFFTLILGAISTAIAGKSFLKLWKAMMLGKKEDLSKEIPQRIGIVMANIFGHKKMFKDFWPGFAHAIIFFGFIVVTLGTAEHVIEGLFHGFSLSFLGPIYTGLVFLQDVFQFLIVAAVLYFFYRRTVSRPARMPKEWAKRKDGFIVLSLTGFHMLANILAVAFFVLSGNEHAHAEARPLSSGLAEVLAGLNLDTATADQLGWISWGVHIATVFAFSMYIPKSKHLHIIAAGPNAFFARLEPKGTFSTINFADETQTQFGVAKFNQFSWKDILDLYSCTQCGRCNEFCPTATTAKPLRPMELIYDLKKHIDASAEPLFKDPAAEPSNPLIGDGPLSITEDTIWACTTCRACVEACPVMIEHVDKIVDMRRNLTMMEGKIPAELQNTFKNWENQSNPWGLPQDSRDEWAKGLNVKTFAEHPNAEYLFYVGCAGSFNDRNKKISASVVKILQKANIDFAILGKEELCNGETARRAGNEYLAKTMIDMNIEVLKRYNVKKIIASCPHCFNSLKNEYPDFGFKADTVVHHTEFIEQLIAENKIKPVLGVDGKEAKDKIRVAFHDSCYLGRYNEIYEAPRNSLRAVPGVEVVELPRAKQKGLCCGAGGARMWMEETIGKRINVERVEEALEQKPDVIAAACPFCQVMVEDGVKAKEATTPVRDIAEIVASSI